MQAIRTLAIDSVWFYAALVFLSVLSLWYVRHEQPRLQPVPAVGSSRPPP